MVGASKMLSCFGEVACYILYFSALFLAFDSIHSLTNHLLAQGENTHTHTHTLVPRTLQSDKGHEWLGTGQTWERAWLLCTWKASALQAFLLPCARLLPVKQGLGSSRATTYPSGCAFGLQGCTKTARSSTR